MHHEELKGKAPEKATHLWDRLTDCIAQNQPRFFKCTWIKGHLDDDKHKELRAELLEKEIICQEDIQWNIEADKLAEEGAKMNCIDTEVIVQAQNRRDLCMVTHRMMINLWSIRVKDIDIRQLLEADQAEEDAAIEQEFRLLEDLGFDDKELDQIRPENQQVIQPQVMPRVKENIKQSSTERTTLQLISEHSGYLWGIPRIEDTTREPVGAIVAKWKGKKIMKDLRFPLELWQPFVKYIDLLLWPTQEDCEQNRWKISFAEWAIDFELWSGFRLEDPELGRETSWARRATYMRLMWTAVLRYSPHLSKVVHEFPQTRVTTLAVFGINTKQQGLNRRPRFIMQKHTERLIALNALQYANPEILKKGKIKTNNSTLTLPTVYTGLQCIPYYKPPQMQELALQLYLKSKGRRSISTKTKVAT
jgi:hypothetical protein